MNKMTQLQDSKREYKNPQQRSDVFSLLCCLKEAGKCSDTASAKNLDSVTCYLWKKWPNLKWNFFCFWISYVHTAKLTPTCNLLKSWNNRKTKEYLLKCIQTPDGFKWKQWSGSLASKNLTASLSSHKSHCSATRIATWSKKSPTKQKNIPEPTLN